MNPTTRRVRRFAASVTFAAVAGSLALPLVATPAGAIQDTTTRRLQGTDRYTTAAAIAADTFPDGATSVVLATGEKFADALAANGLAGALGAPVLLTLQNDLPDATTDALTDLGAETVYLMGGTAAVSQAVEDALAADYTVERVEGENRFETAAAAGAAIAATDDGAPITTDDGLGSTEDGLTAVLAYGLNFPDAVSGGAIAYAGRLPVLLTDTNELPEATLTALEELGIEHVLLVGGTAVIGNGVTSALEADGYTTERLAGNDRWATNAAVNEYAEAEPALAFGGPAAYLSTGSKFADALTGGPAAGANDAPLVLTATAELPAPTRSYLAANANAIDEIVALGGTAAIADTVVAAAADAAHLATNKAFTVTPTESESRPVSPALVGNDGVREFTASGLEAGATYIIALLDAETIDPSGGTTFESYSPSDDASTSIESVDGSPVGAAGGPEVVEQEATAGEGGTITFVIDGADADSVYPVIYEDADGNGVLNLAGQVADEPFGIGGKTTWLPGEAADDTYQGLEVTSFSAEDNYLIAGGNTFLYGTTDRFRSDIGDQASQSITPTQFEGMLSIGDTLDITYFQDAQSLFDVVTDDIPDISGVTASTTTGSSSNAVQVSWTPSTQPDVEYAVYKDDGDRVFDAGDVQMSDFATSSSRSFADADATTGIRYLVLPRGGTTKTVDTTDDAGDGVTYLSNEVQPGVDFVGLTEGTTVARNAGLALLNSGDEWLLHFSRPVQVAANAAVTVLEDANADGDADTGETAVTFTNGTSGSSWAASGSAITITLGSGADAVPDIDYGENLLVTGLSGVRDGSGAAVQFLNDKALEDDGPELMPGSTTCDVGDTTCTLAFNEPVQESSAESRANYTYLPEGGGRLLNAVALGTDLRTITLTFSAGSQAGDTIRPVGPLGAVNDDDGQASDQAAFDFVR